MKKQVSALLTLIIFVVIGCVVEVKKPEINGNTFVSAYPAVNISVDPRFEYLGQVEINKYPTTGDGYVFGIVKDNVVEEALTMLYTSLTSGQHVWEHGRPPGYQHVKKGGYDWVVGYRIFAPKELSNYWKTKFNREVLLKDAYITLSLMCSQTPRSGAIFEVMYMLSIVHDYNFHKWYDFFQNGDRNYLTYDQKSELNKFLSHSKNVLEITEK